MKYKLVIFDMDGTILDTLEDLAASVNYALDCEKMPVRSIDEVRSFVGNGIRKLIERSVPRGTCDQNICKVHERFTAYYTAHCADKTKSYDGIKEFIEQLRKDGYKTAVVSNKADYAVQALCKQYFDGLFDIAAGEQQPLYRKKPHADLVIMVLEKLKVPAESAVYIGDSDIDIQTAHNAGIDCIAVEWGFRSRDFLIANGADVIAADVKELEELIYKHE